MTHNFRNSQPESRPTVGLRLISPSSTVFFSPVFPRSFECVREEQYLSPSFFFPEVLNVQYLFPSFLPPFSLIFSPAFFPIFSHFHQLFPIFTIFSPIFQFFPVSFPVFPQFPPVFPIFFQSFFPILSPAFSPVLPRSCNCIREETQDGGNNCGENGLWKARYDGKSIEEKNIRTYYCEKNNYKKGLKL